MILIYFCVMLTGLFVAKPQTLLKLTKKSFHHIVICYPSDEKGTYFTYIEYMINTLETNETDLG